MENNTEKSSLALRIIIALGAYCPKVKLQNPLTFEIEQMRNKRRKRPLTGRGKYGVGLMAHFANKRVNA